MKQCAKIMGIKPRWCSYLINRGNIPVWKGMIPSTNPNFAGKYRRATLINKKCALICAAAYKKRDGFKDVAFHIPYTKFDYSVLLAPLQEHEKYHPQNESPRD
jgi:hypothetical protein